MNIILSSVHCLPELVNGKVCVVNDDGTFSYYKPTQFTEITDHYNPLNYSILISDKYPKCIVRSRSNERDQYKAKVQLGIIKPLSALATYRKGDKIHLHSRRGIYTIVQTTLQTITVTCKKWARDKNPYHIVPSHDFAGLAGGVYNMSYDKIK